MPENRSVVVRLSANVAGYIAGMRQAKVATKDVLDQTSKAAEKNKDSLRKVGAIAGGIGLAAAAGVGVAVKKFADFDAQMSSVQAATRAANGELDDLRQLALKLGADSQFSATEAAQGIENLAKAGISSADIMGGALKGSLDLAAAGQIEVGDAAEFTATALTQFSLKGDEATHVADLLAAGAGKAQGEVTDMATALNYAGVPAANLGVSIEETAGTIALFAKNGIIGSQAGTSLRGMLSALTSPSKIAAKTMKDLGVEVFDAQGNFIGLDGVADQLKGRMSDLTQEERANALGRIFGNEQLQAANVLYKEGGAGVREWTKNVDDSGFAAETAATKTDNLKGDVERLTGALDSLLISGGSGSDGFLRNATQGLTGLIDGLNKLPQPAKDTALSLGAITAATGAAVFLGANVITRIAETRKALEAMGPAGGKASGALKLLGGAGVALAGLQVAGLALDTLTEKAAGPVPELQATTKALLDLNAATDAKSVRDATKDFDNIGAALARVTGESGGFADDLNEIADKGGKTGRVLAEAGASFFGYNDDMQLAAVGAKKAQNALDGLDGALANIVTSGSPEQAKAVFTQLTTSQGFSADQTERLLGLLPQYGEALDGAANSEQLAADGAGDAGDAVAGMVGPLEDAATAAVTLHDALKVMFNLDADAAISSYKESLSGLAKDLKGGAKNYDINTKAGRENRDAVRERVQALVEAVDAADAEGASLKESKKRLLDGRDAIIAAAKAAGIGEEATKLLLAQYKLTPENIRTTIKLLGANEAAGAIDNVQGKANRLDTTHVTTDVKVNAAGAYAVIDGVRTALRNLDGTVSETYIRTTRIVHTESRLGPPRADGGAIEGYSPSPRADNLLTPTTAGEHIWSVAEVAAAGGHSEVERLRRLARSGQLRFGAPRADGGPVRPASTIYTQSALRDSQSAATAQEVGLFRDLVVPAVPGASDDDINRTVGKVVYAFRAVERSARWRN